MNAYIAECVVQRRQLISYVYNAVPFSYNFLSFRWSPQTTRATEARTESCSWACWASSRPRTRSARSSRPSATSRSARSSGVLMATARAAPLSSCPQQTQHRRPSPLYTARPPCLAPRPASWWSWRTRRRNDRSGECSRWPATSACSRPSAGCLVCLQVFPRATLRCLPSLRLVTRSPPPSTPCQPPSPAQACPPQTWWPPPRPFSPSLTAGSRGSSGTRRGSQHLRDQLAIDRASTGGGCLLDISALLTAAGTTHLANSSTPANTTLRHNDALESSCSHSRSRISQGIYWQHQRLHALFRV